MSVNSRAIKHQTAEEAVSDYINEWDGWDCSPFGPATDHPIRGKHADVLPVSLLRWFPDLIATNGVDIVWLVEVKQTTKGNKDSGAWAIEKQSLDVAKMFMGRFVTPIIYGMVDPENVVEKLVHYGDLIILPRREGPPKQSGPGRPFWLFEKKDAVGVTVGG
jgi:hypothetical protein